MPEGAPRPDTHHWPRADLRCVPSPLTSAEPIRENLGLSPELLAWWVLRRAHRRGIAKSSGQYFDDGHLTLSYLTRTLDELTQAGLLALAGEDPGGLRRVGLTETGHAHYVQLTTTPGRVRLSVPEPQLRPRPRLAAGRAAPTPLSLPAASRPFPPSNKPAGGLLATGSTSRAGHDPSPAREK